LVFIIGVGVGVGELSLLFAMLILVGEPYMINFEYSPCAGLSMVFFDIFPCH